MKHVVTLTTSNPAHEHVSLRRRQSTTNFMVEAADEQTAILRASAHFRRLGHYIHEAKIFKKKEQLNELANSAVIDDSALRVGLKRNPGESDADLVKRISAKKGIYDEPIQPVFPELLALGGGAANVARRLVTQAGSAAFDKLMKSTKDVETGLGNLGTAIVDKGTSAGRIVRDELISHAVSLPVAVGLQAAQNKAAGKETNLGSIVKDDQFWKSNADMPGLSLGSRALRLTGDAGKYAKDVADDVAAGAIKRVQTVGSAANDVVASALERIRQKNLVPGKIDLPSRAPEREPYIDLPPAVAPQPVVPSVKPGVRTDVPVVIPPSVKPGVRPETKPEVKTNPTTVVGIPTTVVATIVVGRADSTMTTKPDLQPKTETSPKIKTDTSVKTKVDTAKPKQRFFPPFIDGGPDTDPGTLGQYRGLFKLYPFADFNNREQNMRESAAMNSIGRVLANRKKTDKDDAKSEKNKINMEPKLGGKA